MIQNNSNFSNSELILGDALDILKTISANHVDMIFADPPYFLSHGGISYKRGKVVCVDKGDWDKEKDQSTIYKFYSEWISECKRILKPNGTIWITGTFHNIFIVGNILNQLEYKILNMVTWVKPSPPPNVSQRMFTHSSEFIIWAKKSRLNGHIFNYNLMKEQNKGKQMTDVWVIPTVTKPEKSFGYHPTQKPLALLERIILSCTKPNDIILDPFAGSCTTGVAAMKLNRRFICIEKDESFYSLGNKRLFSSK